MKKRYIYIGLLFIALLSFLTVVLIQLNMDTRLPSEKTENRDTSEVDQKEGTTIKEKDQENKGNTDDTSEKEINAMTDNNEKVEKMLENMTLEEKVGQLMMLRQPLFIYIHNTNIGKEPFWLLKMMSIELYENLRQSLNLFIRC